MLTFKRTITETEIIYTPKEELIIDISISITKGKNEAKESIYFINVFNKFNGEITSLKKLKNG